MGLHTANFASIDAIHPPTSLDMTEIDLAKIKSVHYPGAGWDDSFLYLPEFQNVKRFHLYDALPNQDRYCPCHPPTEKSNTPERFFNTLSATFGQPKRTTRNIVVFERAGKSIHYHCRVDCATVNVSRDRHAAVYLRGMSPRHIFTHQPIFNSCDSRKFFETDKTLRKKWKHRIIDTHVREGRSCYCRRVSRVSRVARKFHSKSKSIKK